jgi:type 1 glutamine amidotransferase
VRIPRSLLRTLTLTMTMSMTVTFCLAFTCLTPATARAQKKAAKGVDPVKVLLLAGGQRSHHGYRDQALYLSGALEDTGRFEVTIVEDAAILETPAMKKYDLIIVNADRRDPEFKFTEGQQKALLDWVKAGHGYVSIHGADNAAPDWLPEWRDMHGGVFSHVGLPDSKTKQGTFKIKISSSEHPITRGLQDFELKDELYYNLQMKHKVDPLATTEYSNGTWPVAWTREYGEGRVFHTPLGHRGFKPGSEDPIQNPNLQKLLIQGIDWVAEGRKSASATSSPK